MVNTYAGAHVMRHGESQRKQGHVPLADAFDLTCKGIADVEAKSKEIADFVERKRDELRGDLEIAILASPFGRTLHTAKIVYEELARRNIPVPNGVVAEPELEEVRNFDWKLFQPLFAGGKITFGGHTFTVDPAKTNPLGLGAEYYGLDAISKIPSNVRLTLPSWYVKRIDSFEKPMSAYGRLMAILKGFETNYDRNRHVVLATHDGLLGYPTKLFSNGQKSSLNQGESMLLERDGTHFRVASLDGVQEGRELPLTFCFNADQGLLKQGQEPHYVK